MPLIHVAVASVNQTALDWTGNTAHLTQAIEEARAAGAQVLCLPESCIPGYGCEDALLSQGLHRQSVRVLEKLLPLTQDMLVVFGMPLPYEGKLYNVAALVANGQLIGIVPKQHLAGDGVHYEPRWYSPWPAGQRTTIELFGHTVPFGDWAFDLGGVCFGIEICRDAWVEDRCAKALVKRGVQVMLNPTASHFAFDKAARRRDLVKWATENLNVAYLFANQGGSDAGRLIYDGDTRIATPEDYWVGPRLSMRRVSLLDAIIDTESLGQEPSQTEGIKTLPFIWRSPQQPLGASRMDPWQSSPHKKEESFTRAIALGLFDYMLKARICGFVINLSGGADSAACACLVHIMMRIAEQTWGLDGLKKHLDYIPGIDQAKDVMAMMPHVLCCIYQGSTHSSTTTANAAKTVAEQLGASFYQWPIQQLVDDYLECVQTASGQKLDWSTHDIALQNIQARVRSPGAWLVANLRGALLLATSNRSEAAVGYATMDGDTSGGLSPIGGIDKAFLLHWLKWLETQGPEGLSPMPFLNCINQQAPTAELRPGGAQKDEEELMPYTLLNEIEALTVGERLGPVAIFRQLKDRHPDHAALKAHITKFFTLWARNQWKRERYAPAFHVDDKNLDPKSWCRFPMLSGGFVVELENLNSL